MLKNKTGHDKRDVSFDFLKVAATILIAAIISSRRWRFDGAGP